MYDQALKDNQNKATTATNHILNIGTTIDSLLKFILQVHQAHASFQSVQHMNRLLDQTESYLNSLKQEREIFTQVLVGLLKKTDTSPILSQFDRVTTLMDDMLRSSRAAAPRQLAN